MVKSHLEQADFGLANYGIRTKDRGKRGIEEKKLAFNLLNKTEEKQNTHTRRRMDGWMDGQ